jgi:hypothetical protein
MRKYPFNRRKVTAWPIKPLKGVKMKHVFIVDGHDMQQTFQKFADARKAALHAPWSNGTVYRHPAGTRTPCKLTRASWFSLPPAHLTQGRHQPCQPLTPTTSLLESASGVEAYLASNFGQSVCVRWVLLPLRAHIERAAQSFWSNQQ